MNKLVISEGGQPVVLEDLLLLQQNAHAMISNILSLMMNGATAFLSSKPVNRLLSKDETKEVRQIGTSALYFEGYVYDLPGVNLELNAGDKIYVCIRHEETDFRKFEDLQSRACRELLVGYYSNVSDGAYRSWLLSEIPVWAAPGGSNENTGNIPVKWINEFSGTMSSIASRVNRVFTINITSTSSDWHSYNEDGALGTFVVDDSSDYGYLIGKRTPAFVLGDLSYYLEFPEDGVILLRSDSESGVPPFLNEINFEWALSEMTSM